MGLVLLSMIWLVVWLIPPPVLENKVSSPTQSPLGPLTTAEKILLEIPLTPAQLSERDWELLPGIGPSLAKQIISHQQHSGNFSTIEELTTMRGFGEKKLARLRHYFQR